MTKTKTKATRRPPLPIPARFGELALASRRNPQGRGDPSRADVLAHLAGDQPLSIGTDRNGPWLESLRKIFATMPEKEWKRWRDRWVKEFEKNIDEQIQGNVPLVCAHAAYLFPDEPELAAEVARRYRTDDKSPWWAGYIPTYAAASTDSVEVFRLAWTKKTYGIDPYTVIFNVGPAVVPVLEEVFMQDLRDAEVTARKYTDAAETLARWAGFLDVFASFPSEANAKILLDRGELKAVSTLLASSVRADPDTLLREALARAPSKRGLARDLAELFGRQDEGLVRLASTDAERTFARAVIEDAKRGEPATKLPDALRTPPWHGRSIPKIPSVTGLEPAPEPDAMCWKPREQQAWREARASYSDSPEFVVYWFTQKYETAAAQLVTATTERAIDPWRREDCARLVAQLPEEHLRAAWTAFHPTAWRLDSIAAKRVVAKLGLDAVHGLLVRAGVETLDPQLGKHSSPKLYPARPMRTLAQSLEALRPVRSLRLAEAVAQGMMHRQARKHAQAWMLAHPETAVRGLLPIAFGKGKSRPGGEAGLRWLAAQGHEQLVRDVAARASKAAAGAVDQLLSVHPLALARPPKLPAWLPSQMLAPLRLKDGSRVTGDALTIFLGMLAVSTPESPYPALAPAIEACDPSTLAPFAWSLFRLWWLEGADTDQMWALNALAHLADAEHVERLADRMSFWVSDGLAVRVKAGVDILGAIGSDAALTALYRFAEESSAKSLVEAASNKIQEIAEARELTADELADRLVPDLGLGPAGRLWLDLGSTSVSVGLDEALRLSFRDASGKPIDGLPRATKEMDKARYTAAKAQLKTLGKRAQDLAERVIARLEHAMANGRTWPLPVARACFFVHPVMRHLASRLAWVELDGEGRVRHVFRVAEDGSYADENDDACELAPDACVAVLHPLHTSARVLAKLTKLFADYRLISPFPQLSRPTHDVAAKDWTRRLEALAGKTVAPKRLFALEGRRGWERPMVGRSTKTIGFAQICLQYTPGLVGGPNATTDEAQTIRAVSLDNADPSELSAILRSEILCDLASLEA